MSRKNPRLVKRGEIYSCRLPQGEGSVQQRNRPVLIIQNDIGNRFSTTAIVAVLSSKRFNSNYPMHVDIPTEITGLKQNSTILLEQVMTVDKCQLGRRISSIRESSETMLKVDEAIRFSLALK